MKNTDAILIDYILGNNGGKQGKELTELLQQPDIEQRLEELRETLEVFNEVEPVKPSAQLKSNILNSITASKSSYLSGFSDRLCGFFNLTKSRMGEILELASDLSLPHWDRDMLPGANLLHFDGGKGFETADCGIIHLTPGNGIGKHRHNGDEWMLILKGKISSSDQQTYYSGDVIHRQLGTEHSLLVDSNEDCVFAVIAVNGVDFY